MLAQIEFQRSQRAKSLHFFESIHCEDCNSKEDLVQNNYSGDIKCTECLNKLLDAEAEAKEREEYDRAEIEEMIADERRQMQKDSKYE